MALTDGSRNLDHETPMNGDPGIFGNGSQVVSAAGLEPATLCLEGRFQFNSNPPVFNYLNVKDLRLCLLKHVETDSSRVL